MGRLERVIAAIGKPPPPPPPQPADYRLRTPALAGWRAEDLAAGARGLPDGALPEDLREVHPHIYAFTLLSLPTFLALGRELSAAESWVAANRVPMSPPNSMHHYGLELAALGLGPFTAGLAAALRPLCARLFGPYGGDTLDETYAFSVNYGPSGDQDLGFHVDDSEVTLNLCLGERFTGGALWFEGPRCELHRDGASHPDERFVWDHRPGLALLHAGKNRHGVFPIEQGTRRNLILWLRSSAYRATNAGWDQDCPVWCGAR